MRSFLIIRRDAIGDLVCTTPLFTTLRERFPDARLCALVNTYNRAILDCNPSIDKIYAFPNRGHWPDGLSWRHMYGQQISILSELRRENFDFVIHASRSTRRQDKFFGRLIAARRYLKRDHDPAVGHEVVRTLSVLKPLGIRSAAVPPQVYPNTEASLRAHAVLKGSAAGPVPSAIHLSARNAEKQWPLEKYSEFLRRAVKEGGRFVVLWSPGDSNNPAHPGDDEKADLLRRRLTGLPVAFLPTKTVTDLISVLAVCSQLIGCDGGHCHIASGLRIPVLGLYCERYVTDWRPWGPEHQIVSACTVPDICVDDVLAAYHKLPKTSPPQWLR